MSTTDIVAETYPLYMPYNANTTNNHSIFLNGKIPTIEGKCPIKNKVIDYSDHYWDKNNLMYPLDNEMINVGVTDTESYYPYKIALKVGSGDYYDYTTIQGAIDAIVNDTEGIYDKKILVYDTDTATALEKKINGIKIYAMGKCKVSGGVTDNSSYLNNILTFYGFEITTAIYWRSCNFIGCYVHDMDTVTNTFIYMYKLEYCLVENLTLRRDSNGPSYAIYAQFEYCKIDNIKYYTVGGGNVGSYDDFCGMLHCVIGDVTYYASTADDQNVWVGFRKCRNCTFNGNFLIYQNIGDSVARDAFSECSDCVFEGVVNFNAGSGAVRVNTIGAGSGSWNRCQNCTIGGTIVFGNGGQGVWNTDTSQWYSYGGGGGGFGCGGGGYNTTGDGADSFFKDCTFPATVTFGIGGYAGANYASGGDGGYAGNGRDGYWPGTGGDGGDIYWYSADTTTPPTGVTVGSGGSQGGSDGTVKLNDSVVYVTSLTLYPIRYEDGGYPHYRKRRLKMLISTAYIARGANVTGDCTFSCTNTDISFDITDDYVEVTYSGDLELSNYVYATISGVYKGVTKTTNINFGVQMSCGAYAYDYYAEGAIMIYGSFHSTGYPSDAIKSSSFGVMSLDFDFSDNISEYKYVTLGGNSALYNGSMNLVAYKSDDNTGSVDITYSNGEVVEDEYTVTVEIP